MSETTVKETAGRPLAAVTGASSGIGRELAAQFAENGYDLVVAAEDERIESVARSFTGKGVRAVPVQANLAYAASKAFLLSFGEAVRYELRDTGVTITALMPGPTDTEFFDRAGMQGTKLREDTPKDDPAQVAREGIEALMAGQDHVVAGSMKNKVQAVSGRLLPEPAKAATQARMTEPGSGGQPDPDQ